LPGENVLPAVVFPQTLRTLARARPARAAPAELRAGLLQQKLAKGGIEPIKGLIRQFPDPPQRMAGRDPLLDRHFEEQRAAALLLTSYLG
jgi:hypothetical protein